MTTMNLSMGFFETLLARLRIARSCLFEHGRQQQGTPRQLGDDDVLVHGVRALAHGAHAVERGNADAGGEVAVGAFHGQTIDASRDLELAMLVEGLQRAQLAVETNFLFRALDAHVDLYGGFGGDYVGARASLNDTGIYRDSAPQIVELCDRRDLAGKFQDGAMAFAGIKARVRGDAFDFQRVLAHSFAFSLERSAQSGCRFEHQHGRRLSASASVVGRDELLPTSSSDTRKTVTGRGSSPCHVFRAAIACIIRTMPAFMSRTPGPWRRSPATPHSIVDSVP